MDDQLDLSLYVPQNYPELMSYRSQGCPCPPDRCPVVPCYPKEYFCSEWGKSFKCICPQERFFPNPFQGVREELQCLDYFTRLPDNPKGRYPRLRSSPRFSTMAFKYGLDDINDCPKVGPGWSRICPENQKMFNLIHKDAVCGLCVPPERAWDLPCQGPPDCSEGCMTCEDMYDLPFRVKIGAFPEPEKPKPPRTGVARCLQPSTFHDLQSVHRDSFRNFYKIKTDQQLGVYRSPLAIDTRRPMLTIPRNPNRDLVLSGPICVNALPLVMRPKGPRKLPKNLSPNFQVFVQGPICI